MFKNKTGKERQIRETEKHTLRMLRSDDAFQASPVSTWTAHREGAYEHSQKIIRDTILEAEYKKAKALCSFQNSARFC